MTPRVFILGIPIDAVRLSHVLERMRWMLADARQHHVMTPNPEMLVAAQTNTAFYNVLLASSLNVPDGFGLVLASRFLSSPLPGRVTGVDVVTEFCRQTKEPVFFLGAGEGIAARTATVLKENNPSLVIAGTFSGSPAEDHEDAIIERINASGARVLFVAYGAPIQDLWIAQNLKKMMTVKIAMGVGGTFDFLAGVRRRAPVFVRSLGLEWLWRLFHEPKRMKRIFTAVVVFPYLVLRSRWSRRV